MEAIFPEAAVTKRVRLGLQVRSRAADQAQEHRWCFFSRSAPSHLDFQFFMHVVLILHLLQRGHSSVCRFMLSLTDE